MKKTGNGKEMTVLDRFLGYVAIDSPSDPLAGEEGAMPSSRGQKNMAKRLTEELRAMGLDAETDENGYVYAVIEGNAASSASIALISHMDTVCEPEGCGIKPQIVKNYDGGDIALPSGDVISPNDFPEMKNYVGEDIVTGDGTTILGADDKAGVAEIMTVAKYITDHPEFKHGKVGIAFTPDEEIGMGASRFDVGRLGCDFGYTVDGEQIGELSYETFNAAGFRINVTGTNTHPGSAKDMMVNSILIAGQLIAAFPEDERPENTEGREGFYFIDRVSGNVEKTVIEGIVRDHDRDLFEQRKQRVTEIVDGFKAEYGDRISMEMKDQYYNCGEIITPHIHLINNATSAMEKNGVTPIIYPIRGGTDGSGLSFKGLPCPNLSTGGHNAHSVKEFVPVQSMEKMVQIILDILGTYALPF